MMVYVMFYIFSILMVMGCNNWFFIWVGLEINMMSFIALIYKQESSCIEVCMKYFFIQSLGSGILMMMFYSEFKMFEYIVAGVLSYKIGAGPFFFWFPSLCESLGWGSCFLLMTVQKILPILLISLTVSMFLWYIIIMSITIGAFGSMNQKNMKRLLAYSSIHHVGWILLTVYLFDLIWFVYLLMYMFMISGVIYNLSLDGVLDISMLSKMTSKWVFVMGMFSMGGMPPMLGFYIKWGVMYHLMSVDFTILFLMILMSVLMFYVYFRVIYMLIMGEKNNPSWMMVYSNKKIFDFNMMYIMGINMGAFVWMML